MNFLANPIFYLCATETTASRHTKKRLRGDQCIGSKNTEIAYSCLLHRSVVFHTCSQSSSSSIVENLLNCKFLSPTLDLQKVWGLGPSNPINRKVLRDTQVWKQLP